MYKSRNESARVSPAKLTSYRAPACPHSLVAVPSLTTPVLASLKMPPSNAFAALLAPPISRPLLQAQAPSLNLHDASSLRRSCPSARLLRHRLLSASPPSRQLRVTTSVPRTLIQAGRRQGLRAFVDDGVPQRRRRLGRCLRTASTQIPRRRSLRLAVPQLHTPSSTSTGFGLENAMLIRREAGS